MFMSLLNSVAMLKHRVIMERSMATKKKKKKKKSREYRVKRLNNFFNTKYRPTSVVS